MYHEIHVAEVALKVPAADAVVELNGVGEQAVGANGGLQSMEPKRKAQQNKRPSMTGETRVLWMASLWKAMQLSKQRQRAQGRGLMWRKLLQQTQCRPSQSYLK